MLRLLGLHLRVLSLPSYSCFLCCDWLRLAAGSESGRSSPYYGQEGRSSTPTTNQPPRHFHVPGRPHHLLITPLTISFVGFYHSALKQIIQKGLFKLRGCENVSRIFIPHIIALAYTSPHTASLPPSTFLYNHLSYLLLLFLASHHINTNSQLLCLSFIHVSPLHLLFLFSATGDPNIYRKPPIYKRTGTVQLAPP